MTEKTYEYKGKLYSRQGDTWLDRDRLLVSDLIAARLTMEVDGKPMAPPVTPAKAKANKAAKAAKAAKEAKALAKAEKAEKAAKAEKVAKPKATKKKKVVEEAAE